MSIKHPLTKPFSKHTLKLIGSDGSLFTPSIRRLRYLDKLYKARDKREKEKLERINSLEIETIESKEIG